MNPRGSTALLVLFMVISCPEISLGKFGSQSELQSVPISRLEKNLTQSLKKDPKNPSLIFTLARLHAMAYAYKQESGNILSSSKNGYPIFFRNNPTDAGFPFQVTPTTNKNKLENANKHLYRAIGLFWQAYSLAPRDPVITLGLGWVLDQAGQHGKARERYRHVLWLWTNKKARWTSSTMEEDSHWGHFRTVPQEAAFYLIPLLDPQEDKAEILKLKEILAERNQRKITPLALPIESRDFTIPMTHASSTVLFDLDGLGSSRWTWIPKGWAWLVWDPNNSSKVASGLQLFGSVTWWVFWDHGYQALSALDDNHDGILRNLELRNLSLWQDEDSDGVSDPGEVRPLAEWNIVSLSCRSESHPTGIPYSPKGVTFSDGRIMPSYDVILETIEEKNERVKRLRITSD